MNPFRVTWRPRRGYRPTAPVTGEAADYIYRGLNAILKGIAEDVYLEQWNGYNSVDSAGSNSTLSGTVATTSGSATVTGTSTKFQSELIIGQVIIINSRVYGVQKIISNTSMEVSPLANASSSGLTVTYLKQVQDVDFFRGSFIRGSLVRLPQGHLLGVGLGDVRLDGSTLTDPLTLRNVAQIAIFDNGTGNYGVYKLGMQTPTLSTVGTTSGGVKNMQPGTYSVRIVPYKMTTGGFNNPSESVEVTITTAGDKINITFPAMDTNAGQDAWRVYGTLYSTGEATTGPWYYVTTVTATNVATGGGAFAVEWHDAEIQSNDILEFDNDVPPHGAFIGSLGGLPVLISTNGQGRVLDGTVSTTNGSATVTGSGTSFNIDLAVGSPVWINNLLRFVLTIGSATSMTVTPTPTATASGLTIRIAESAPGPVLRPAKPYLGGYNIEAFPAKSAVAVNPPETILGFVQGVGRLYLMTRNHLHVAALSGDPDVPVTTRPFWRVGFRNPRACLFVNGYLYAFTTNGATRSSADGDTVMEEHGFAAAVASDMASWDPAKVSVGYDAKNEAVVFFHADDGTRSGGTKRYSTALMYMLRIGEWSPPIRIEDTTDTVDRWVSSCATVNGKLYFAATNSSSTSIYEWDTGGGVGVVYVATPFMDADSEAFDHNINGLAITAHGSSVTGQIHGSVALEDVPIADLEAGTNSESGDISFTSGSGVRTSQRAKLNCRRLRVFAARMQLSSSGLNSARLDELVMDGKMSQVKY